MLDTILRDNVLYLKKGREEAGTGGLLTRSSAGKADPATRDTPLINNGSCKQGTPRVVVWKVLSLLEVGLGLGGEGGGRALMSEVVSSSSPGYQTSPGAVLSGRLP